LSDHESSIAIIIGRGRANKEHLGPRDWGAFQSRIIDYLNAFGQFFRLVYAIGYGSGGVEENCTIFANIPDAKLDDLRAKLLQLGLLYEQDAILLLVGDLEVIAS
jgi:hypothetical protein